MNSGDGSMQESVEACAARESSEATSSDITIVPMSATTAEIESNADPELDDDAPNSAVPASASASVQQTESQSEEGELPGSQDADASSRAVSEGFPPVKPDNSADATMRESEPTAGPPEPPLDDTTVSLETEQSCIPLAPAASPTDKTQESAEVASDVGISDAAAASLTPVPVSDTCTAATAVPPSPLVEGMSTAPQPLSVPKEPSTEDRSPFGESGPSEPNETPPPPAPPAAPTLVVGAPSLGLVASEAQNQQRTG